MFEPVAARYDGPELEKGILEFWRRENVFGRIMAEGAARPKFVFYEGPPTANGRPGHPPRARAHVQGPLSALQDDARLPLPAQSRLGHARPARRARDRERARHLRQAAHRAGSRHRELHGAVPRVRDAPRRRVGSHDRAHGLLGRLRGRLLHAAQRLHRERLVPAEADLGQGPHLSGLQGRALRPAHRRDAVVARGGARAIARSRTRRSTCASACRAKPNTYFLVWTTTPWTLPANLLLAVHPDVEYVWVEARRRDADPREAARRQPSSRTRTSRSSAARSAASSTACATSGCSTICRPRATICRVRPAEFVTTEDGTGIVHVAPAYGEDDLKLGQRHGLPVLHAVGEDGYFLAGRHARRRASSSRTPTRRSSRSCASAACCSARRSICTTIRSAGAPAIR